MRTLDEALRICHQIVPHIRMSVQIGIQLSVVLNVVMVLDGRRVPRKILLDVRVASKESSEVRHVIVHGIAVAAIPRAPIFLILLPHERVWVLL